MEFVRHIFTKNFIVVSMLILILFWLVNIVVLLHLYSCDKEELKISSLNEEDLNSYELVKFLIYLDYNNKNNNFFKTKLIYLRKLITLGQFILLLFFLLTAIYVVIN